MKQTIFEAAGGLEAFLKLSRAWHARCLADPVVSHAFSHGHHPQHSERLAAYWAEALGGPPDYSHSMGNESVVLRLHSGNGEHADMDQRARACFAQALDDAGIPEEPLLRATLLAYFAWAEQRMNQYPDTPDRVPRGLTIGHWSWDGPV